MEESPPLSFLKIVIKNCPHAALTYIMLWAKKDNNSRVRVTTNVIWKEFLMPHNKFKNHLLALSSEGLISFYVIDKLYDIEVVKWDEIDFSGHALC
jgi:hypothetical protein